MIKHGKAPFLECSSKGDKRVMENKKMRPPTIKIGKFRIRYRQVPYVNRFFFVDYQRPDYGCPCKLVWDKNLMKIQDFRVDKIEPYQIFGFVESPQDRNRLYNFLDKVKEYDKYLDIMDD